MLSRFIRFYNILFLKKKTHYDSFTVFIFLITSVICFAVLTARRVVIGGELGGPRTSKIFTLAFKSKFSCSLRS